MWQSLGVGWETCLGGGGGIEEMKGAKLLERLQSGTKPHPDVSKLQGQKC